MSPSLFLFNKWKQSPQGYNAQSLGTQCIYTTIKCTITPSSTPLEKKLPVKGQGTPARCLQQARTTAPQRIPLQVFPLKRIASDTPRKNLHTEKRSDFLEQGRKTTPTQGQERLHLEQSLKTQKTIQSLMPSPNIEQHQ